MGCSIAGDFESYSIRKELFQGEGVLARVVSSAKAPARDSGLNPCGSLSLTPRESSAEYHRENSIPRVLTREATVDVASQKSFSKWNSTQIHEKV
jgi:hypothetical protein